MCGDRLKGANQFLREGMSKNSCVPYAGPTVTMGEKEPSPIVRLQQFRQLISMIETNNN